MRVTRLWLRDFRCYERVELEPAPGCTVIVGANGQGKTSLLEAVSWAATAKSFRGVPDSALVRSEHATAIVRVEIEREGNNALIEAEIHAGGRNRVLVNKQRLARVRDLLGMLRVTVFAPDDLQLVKGGPSQRREYLDDLLVAITPRYEAARADYEKVLRQRNALLKAGVRTSDDQFTLDVFDEQLARAGAELVCGRARLAAQLVPELVKAYSALASADPGLDARYETEWGPVSDDPDTGELFAQLRDAYRASRSREIERRGTLLGPHRDDWRLRMDGLEARTHASQGEQRTLALALRLAGHRVCADAIGTEPVLLLDDVFSELDPSRSEALIAHLPAGQTLLTTAATVPAGVCAEERLRVHSGRVEREA